MVEDATGPTLNTVARAIGVSRQTVSNAINAPEKVHPATLARVEAEIEQQGYRANNRARSLRIQRSALLGYCVRHPAWASVAVGGIMDRFVHAITRAAEQRGQHILLFTEDDSGPETAPEMAVYQDLFAHRVVDGFVLSDTHVGDQRQAWLAERKVPFAAFGRRWDSPERGPWVDVDGAAGTAAAVDHVVAAGHRRVAFVGWPEGSGVGDDRRAGWRRACRSHGLDDVLVRTATDGIDQGRALGADLLARGPDRAPTAFVCVSDTFAIGCLQAVRDRGLEPGRDVAVVGFDDSPAASLPGIGLTSVRQPIDEAGDAVVRLATDVLLDPGNTGERTEGLLLPPTLVVRTSSVAAT